MLELVIAIIFTFVVCGYLWWKQRFQYWEKLRVPHLKSESLFFGNNRDVFYGKVPLGAHVQRIYNALAPHKYGGAYLFSRPVLYVRDPELVNRVLISDFHHFHDHTLDMAHEYEPLSLNLSLLTGKEWDILRRRLSPAFTSGKMKILFELMVECAEKLEKIVEKSATNQEAVNVKDLMARYGIDVISSCAFGLEADSLNDANSEFRKKAKEIFSPSLRLRLYLFVLNTSPKLLPILRIPRFSRNVSDFFMNLVDETVKYRKENGVVRNDFLDLLRNAQKDETKQQKNYDFNLAAQCFLFFLAGFETSANSLSFILYELAEHPDIQKKLQEEIDRVLALHNGKITYDSLNEMTFMEQVFNETSRLFPALSFLKRICTEDYRFPGSDLVIKRGVTIHVPVQGLHRDPKYYPNPNVFNPENFSKEAKNSRPTCTFLPFGDGPRNCIGLRFGLMQVKLALTTILRKYTVTISPEMKLPLELKPYSTTTTSKNNILLNFRKRTE